MNLLIIMFVLVAVGAGYRHFSRSGGQPSQNTTSDPRVHSGKTSTTASSPGRLFFAGPKSGHAGIRMSVGDVVIEDIAGNEIFRFKATVSESGWVAIPARFCVGGYSWYFYSSSADQLEINGGILGDRDDIGLWQLKDINPLPGPPISPAQPDQRMTWMSFVSERQNDLEKAPVLSEQQNFYHIDLPPSIDEPGVIIQDQKLVGWVFSAPAGGYLWKGPDEKNLVYELSVYDFYRLTFENSREEQFIIAYSRSAIPLPERLKAFADGFRHEPVLFEDNTPSHLKTLSVIQEMRAIISQISDQKIPVDMLSIFDAEVLSNIGNVTFMEDVLSADPSVLDPEQVIDIIENVLSAPGHFDEDQIRQIRRFQQDLYEKFLNRLMGEGNYTRGLSVYRQAADRFSDAPTIHLLGARLALSFDDWKTAEHILYSQRFPVEMTDQVRIVENQIRELKFQADKIVVRFPPGSGGIPVTGTVNGRLKQDFVIDTGASMVTIPTHAAEKLGIEIDGGTPVHELITVGGIIDAPQVVLESIQIGKWTEYHVTAYVVDMPGQKGLGLLGLNYLNRFHMDLNTRAGVLTLTPR